MAFQLTTAIRKLLAMKARKKVVQGSTSAGKTYGIIPVLIDRATKSARLKITVVAESIPAIRDGAMQIFKDVMLDTGRWVESRWNATLLEYTFANKTTIKFTSFDSVGKAAAAGKRHILFINEANNVPFEIADALMIRTTQEIWLDFNPVGEFWAHTEVLTEPNSELLVLTYEDNEALPIETREDLRIKMTKAFHNPRAAIESFKRGRDPDKKNIKNDYWANWCKVYVFGQIGSLQGVVYTNWGQVDDIPKNTDGNIIATFVARGLDFGFTNQAALIDVYLYNGELYLDERVYETQLTGGMLVERFRAIEISRYECIVADSAEPKSITELQRAGYYVEPADKGPDSVRMGVKIMQEYRINVTSRSLNLIGEMRGYKWATKTDGTKLEVPVNANNHLIRAAEYVALNKLSKFVGTGHYAIEGGNSDD